MNEKWWSDGGDIMWLDQEQCIDCKPKFPLRMNNSQLALINNDLLAGCDWNIEGWQDFEVRTQIIKFSPISTWASQQWASSLLYSGRICFHTSYCPISQVTWVLSLCTIISHSFMHVISNLISSSSLFSSCKVYKAMTPCHNIVNYPTACWQGTGNWVSALDSQGCLSLLQRVSKETAEFA